MPSPAKSTSALLFAPIGPNPASLTEAVWALRQQQRVCVVEAHVVSMREGSGYLWHEILAPGQALDELRTVMSDVLPAAQASIVEHLARFPNGTPIEDDSTTESCEIYRRALWAGALACQERAGERPVVFLLAGGRLRTTTAYATTVFQLLARPQDALFDVRVSERRAEGGSGFFFPEQSGGPLFNKGGEFQPQDVQVHLIPVEVPRLEPLLKPGRFASFDEALAASNRAIESAKPPQLVVDLNEGIATVSGEKLPLTPGELAWYGLLAAERRSAEAEAEAEEGWVPADGMLERFKAVMQRIAKARWLRELDQYEMRMALGLEDLRSEAPRGNGKASLRTLRSNARKRLRKALKKASRPGWESLVVPDNARRGGKQYDRIALDPARIEIVWPT